MDKFIARDFSLSAYDDEQKNVHPILDALPEEADGVWIARLLYAFPEGPGERFAEVREDGTVLVGFQIVKRLY